MSKGQGPGMGCAAMLPGEAAVGRQRRVHGVWEGAGVCVGGGGARAVCEQSQKQGRTRRYEMDRATACDAYVAKDGGGINSKREGGGLQPGASAAKRAAAHASWGSALTVGAHRSRELSAQATTLGPVAAAGPGLPQGSTRPAPFSSTAAMSDAASRPSAPAVYGWAAYNKGAVGGWVGEG